VARAFGGRGVHAAGARVSMRQIDESTNEREIQKVEHGIFASLLSNIEKNQCYSAQKMHVCWWKMAR
jgi:hypothetical protein